MIYEVSVLLIECLIKKYDISDLDRSEKTSKLNTTFIKLFPACRYSASVKIDFISPIVNEPRTIEFRTAALPFPVPSAADDFRILKDNSIKFSIRNIKINDDIISSRLFIVVEPFTSSKKNKKQTDLYDSTYTRQNSIADRTKIIVSGNNSKIPSFIYRKLRGYDPANPIKPYVVFELKLKQSMNNLTFHIGRNISNKYYYDPPLSKDYPYTIWVAIVRKAYELDTITIKDIIPKLSLSNSGSTAGYIVGICLSVIIAILFISLFIKFIMKSYTRKFQRLFSKMTLDGEQSLEKTITNYLKTPLSTIWYHKPRAGPGTRPIFRLPSRRLQVYSLKDFYKIERNGKILSDYFRLPTITTEHIQFTAGRLSSNLDLNQSRMSVPFDDNRYLPTDSLETSKEYYINASIISAPEGIESLKPFDKAMIATQYPLKNTITDFWLLVWSSKTKNIILLMAMDEEFCDFDRYWPIDGGYMIFKDLKVTLKREIRRNFFTVREFRLTNGCESRKITQYQYASWTMDNKPSDMLSFISFTRVIDDTTQPNDTSIIQDKEGGSRCGLYIACRLSFFQAKISKKVDILKICSHLSVERVNIIGNGNQMGFIYWFVIERVSLTDHVIRIDSELQLSNSYQQLHEEYYSLSALLPENCSPRQNTGILNYFDLDSYSMKNRFLIINTPTTTIQIAYFWSVIFDSNVSTIINLDKTTSGTLCNYWPQENKQVTYGEFKIVFIDYTKLGNRVALRQISITKFNLQKSTRKAKTRKMYIFHTIDWPKDSSLFNNDESVAILQHLMIHHSRFAPANRILLHTNDRKSTAFSVVALYYMMEMALIEEWIDIFHVVRFFNASSLVVASYPIVKVR
ncbi:DgyrCDS1174 [Dimorphilus gyrociliatus]|uniref:DgyrCDS1174 n=1 Tax=Dimorphilus gyrociliatus TaxID=2664684 RepID=A0A7I8V6H2_9ANNE|nr:DgyrCDS1174 [Dimorphilus gyrociliatus]